MAGADYLGPECPPSSQICSQKAATLRVMVFKTDKAAQAYWKQSCPGCSYRKDRLGGGGWVAVLERPRASRRQSTTVPNERGRTPHSRALQEPRHSGERRLLERRALCTRDDESNHRCGRRHPECSRAIR